MMIKLSVMDEEGTTVHNRVCPKFHKDKLQMIKKCESSVEEFLWIDEHKETGDPDGLGLVA